MMQALAAADQQPQGKKRTCLPCRERKRKCDGSSPCERCVSAGIEERCVAQELQKRGRKAKDSSEPVRAVRRARLPKKKKAMSAVRVLPSQSLLLSMIFSHGLAAVQARPRDFAASFGLDLGKNFIMLQIPDVLETMGDFRYDKVSFAKRVEFLGTCIGRGRICAAMLDVESEMRLPTGDSLFGKSLSDVGRPAPNREAFLASKRKDPKFEKFVNPSMMGACQVKHQDESYPSILYDAVSGGDVACRARNVSFFDEKHTLRFLVVLYDLTAEEAPLFAAAPVGRDEHAEPPIDFPLDLSINNPPWIEDFFDESRGLELPEFDDEALFGQGGAWGDN